MSEELSGGWRKKTSREKDLVISVYKCEDEKIADNGIRYEKKARDAGLLVRDFVGKVRIKDVIEVRWRYKEGLNKWQWSEKDSFEVGKICRRLHNANLYHLDMKPGNVLWNNKGEVEAVIDFDECHKGTKWKWKDLGNTLSWVLVSGGSEKEFREGYKHDGGNIDDVKLEQELIKLLTMRQNEKNNQAWIELAKRRLETYKQEVAARCIKEGGLTDFREKNKRQRIVFVVGAFELLHWGHLEYLKKARNRGDVLVVGVATDESRKRLKGDSFPLIGEQTRMETLCFFGSYVDGVVIVDEDNVVKELEQLKPEVVVTTKKDWADGVRKVEEEELVKSYGGRVIKVDYLKPQISSSELVTKVAMLKARQLLLDKISRQPILKIYHKLIITKRVEIAKLRELGEKVRKQHKTIVFTSLSADLFHVGHARFIQKAKSLGEVLVIGLPSNKSLRELRGPGRPIVDETARAWVLAELKDTDYVVIFDERTILTCLQELKPDVFFTVKEDWNQGLLHSPEAQFMQSIGGKVVRSERMAPFISASKIIDRAAGELIRNRFAGVLKVAKDEPVINADFDPFSPQAQLAARERGFYEKVWQTAAAMKCVFCDLKAKYIISEKNGMVLTVALYPYLDGHLLIIPKRHVESIKELTEEERQGVFELANCGAEVLKERLGIDNYWLLVREGEGMKTKKTVPHLHFHLHPYDANVIKMFDAKLTIAPIDMAKKLRGESV